MMKNMKQPSRYAFNHLNIILTITFITFKNIHSFSLHIQSIRHSFFHAYPSLKSKTSLYGVGTDEHKDLVSSLLDAEQEKGIIGRALKEKEWLKSNQSVLEEATEEEREKAFIETKKKLKETKKRNRSKGNNSTKQGFGAKAKAKNKDTTSSIEDYAQAAHIYFPNSDKTKYGAVVMEEGVARVNNALSHSTADLLLSYTNNLLLSSLKDVEEGKVPERSRFANVLLKSNRWDLLLPFEEITDEHGNDHSVIMKGLDELLGKDGSILSIVESILGSKAVLYELGALISDPGSDRQVIHPDIPYEDQFVPLLTCFISLQNVDETMGPTVFLPKSSNAETNTKFNDKTIVQEVLSNHPNKISLLNKGDCSIYDPMTLHAGGGNESETRRTMFYFTFRNPSYPDPSTERNPGSLRPELRENKITLSEIKKKLAKYRIAHANEKI